MMSGMQVAKRVKCRIQSFSEDTVLHGFKQFYFAKSIVSKIIWGILLTVVCTTAFYQIADIIDRAKKKPTVTTILPLDWAAYPKLQICQTKWLYWIDGDKVKRFNLDRETFQYAMTFMDKVYTTAFLNVTDAEKNLDRILSKNNFTIHDLFLILSRDEPFGFSGDYNYSKEFYTFDSSRLCYIPDLQWNRSKYETELEISLTYRDNFYTLQEFVTRREYIHYVIDATNVDFDMNITIATVCKDDIFIPPSIMIHEEQEVLITNNFFEYVITLQGTNYKWLNSERFPCDTTQLTMYSDYDLVCKQKCHYVGVVEKGQCINFSSVGYIGFNDVLKLCTHELVYLNDKDERTTVLEPNTFVQKGNLMKKTENDCLQPCKSSCEQWIYDMSVVKNQHPSKYTEHVEDLPTSNIQIIYPLPQKMLMVAENPGYTVESLLANVGGVLSIWTGASVVAFFQMIYLCCCSQFDSNEEKSGDDGVEQPTEDKDMCLASKYKALYE